MNVTCTDEIADFPTTHSLGKKLDCFQDQLCCPICNELYKNPEMLKCGHTYCSLCIRRHCDATINRTTHSECPSCRAKADVFELRKNIVLSNLSDHFKSLSHDLASFIDVSVNGIAVAASASNESSSTRPSNRSGATGKVITKCMTQFSTHGVPKDKLIKRVEQATMESRVKLRVDGDRDAFERRVKEFVHLHNAQIGATHPLSLDQVIHRINEQSLAVEAENRRLAKTVAKPQERKFQDLAKAAMSAKQSSSSTSSSTTPSSSTTVDSIKSATSSDMLHRWGWLMSLSSEAMGPWTVALHAKDGRPFFFNMDGKYGQFSIPPEIFCLQPTEMIDQEEIEGIPPEKGSPSQAEARGVLLSSDSYSHELLPPLTQTPGQDNDNDDSMDDDEEDGVEVQSTLVPTMMDTATATAATAEGDGEVEHFDLTQDANTMTQQQQRSPEHAEGKWSCEQCTYRQPNNVSQCEMCGHKNQAYFNIASKPRRSNSGSFTYNEDKLKTVLSSSGSSRKRKGTSAVNNASKKQVVLTPSSTVSSSGRKNGRG